MTQKLTDAQFQDRAQFTLSSVEGLIPEDQLQVLTGALIGIAELNGFRPSTIVTRFAEFVESAADEPGRFPGPFIDGPPPSAGLLDLKSQMQARVGRAVDKLTNAFNAIDGDPQVRMSAVLNLFALSVLAAGIPDEEAVAALRAGLRHARDQQIKRLSSARPSH